MKQRAQAEGPRIRCGLLLAWGATFAGIGCTAAVDKGSASNDAPVAQVIQSATASYTGRSRGSNTRFVHRFVVLAGKGAVAALPPGLAISSPKAQRLIREQLGRIDEQQAQVQPQLEALGATVVGRFRKLGNAFHVRIERKSEPRLQAIAAVRSVQAVPRFEPSLSSALPFIGVPQAWSAAGSVHGAGVRIGIIDTGLDYYHAGLGGDGQVASYQADDPTQIEVGSFPTTKVAGGYDFAGDNYDAGDEALDSPSPDPDPLDCRTESQNGYSGGHGSHVGGIAGGNGVLADGSPFYGPYNQSLDPNSFSVFPGVAPEATLYALKVFGCDGSTNLVFQALEWASDPNQDDNLDDRLDVVNASLGAGFGAYAPFTATVVKNMHKLGGLFVASAGNDGNTLFITGQPATVPHALSVANAGDSPYVTVSTLQPENLIEDLPAYEANFTRRLKPAENVEGTLLATEPPTACTEPSNAGTLAGAIALIDRGTCSFATKVEQAESAGALAAIVINNDLNGSPFAMTSNDSTATIPAVMIGYKDGQLLRQQLGENLRIRIGNQQYKGLGTGLMSGSSSRGPSAMLPMLKPEITGPGSGILSVQVGSGFGAANKSGTSMSGPAVAGAAALLRQAHPSFEVDTIKALLMNSSSDVRAADGEIQPVSRQGAGYLNIAASMTQSLSLRSTSDDGSIAVNIGSIILAETGEASAQVRIDNHGNDNATATLDASLTHALAGLTVSIEPSSVQIAAGESQLATLRVLLDPKALGRPPAGPLTATAEEELPSWWFHEAGGFIRLSQITDKGTNNLRLPFFGIVRAASNTQATPPRTCGVENGSEPLGRYSIALDGMAGAHPSPTVSVFELAERNELNPLSENDPNYARADLRAVGISYTKAAGENEAMVYIAAALEADWVTPTFSSQSVINVLIDSDDDANADYYLRGETFEDSAVFATRLYNLEDGEPVGRQHFLNMVPATEADTALLHNSVIVLPFAPSDVGLDDERTAFRFRVTVSSPFLADLNERSAWIDYDTATPAVDTSRFAPRKGQPLFYGENSIDVWLNPSTKEEATPELLLLHHNAATPQQRWQVVNLGNYSEEQVDLSFYSADQAIASNALALGEVRIRNQGNTAVHQLQIAATIGNGSWALVNPPPGLNCSINDAAAEVDCTIDSLAVAEELRVGVQFRSQEEPATVIINSRSSLGCEDEQVFALAIETSSQPETLRSSGGCACRSGSAPKQRLPQAWVWVLTALLAWQRRRPEKLKKQSQFG